MFTPGPWKAHGASVYQEDNYINGDNTGGRRILSGTDCEDTDIDNARLIAAAPEMYNALDKIASDGGMTPEDGERFLHEVIIPLLAKIEGRECDMRTHLNWHQEELLKELFKREVLEKRMDLAIGGIHKTIVKPLIKKGYIHKDTYKFTGLCRITEKGIAFVGNKGL